MYPHTYVMELERTLYGRARHPYFRTVVLAWFSICSRIRGNAYVHIFLGTGLRIRSFGYVDLSILRWYPSPLCERPSYSILYTTTAGVHRISS